MKTIQRPRIELYVRRTFSEKLSATFDFISENFRPLFRYLSAFLLPLCVVSGMCYTVLFGQIGDLSFIGATSLAPMMGIGINYILLLVLSVLSLVMVSAVTFTLMQFYWAREERLTGIVYKEISSLLKVNTFKMLRLTGVSVLLGLAALLLLVLVLMFSSKMYEMVNNFESMLSLMLLVYMVLLAAIVPLVLAAPAYVFGSFTVWQAIRQAYRLGIRVWGGLAGMLIVFALIVNLVSMALGLPYIILNTVKMISLGGLADGDMSFAGTPWYTFLTYLSGVLFMYGTCMAMALVQVGAAFYYGHAAEKIDGVAMDMAVEKFETLTGRTTSPMSEDMTAGVKRNASRPTGSAADEIDDFENL